MVGNPYNRINPVTMGMRMIASVSTASSQTTATGPAFIGSSEDDTTDTTYNGVWLHATPDYKWSYPEEPVLPNKRNVTHKTIKHRRKRNKQARKSRTRNRLSNHKRT